MVLTLADLPLTAAVSTLRVVAQTRSTNADVLAAVRAEPDEWGHLSLLVTDDQTAGRGRLDRTWTAPAGSALAASILLEVSRLPMHLRGWIPLMAGTAMAEAIGAQLPLHTVRVKWPNDVLVDGRKICGILAEVADGSHVVVGAGVNTAMTPDQLPVPTATSFGALGEDADRDRLLRDAVWALDDLVEATSVAGDVDAANVRARVQAQCATIGESVRVHLPGGRQLVGTAVGLAASGGLLVDSGTEVTEITAGDVVHVRPV